MTTEVKQFRPVLEGGLTELVGVDEQVDQNDLSGSVGVSLEGGDNFVSGEILSFLLVFSESGTGTVLEPTGQILVFDADPAISSGDTAITTAEHGTLLGIVNVEAADWLYTDANGASAYIVDTPIPFHNVKTLYFAFFNTLATAINSAAGDEELLQLNFWWRREN